MAKFQGGGYYAVDDKGRVVIPLKFRSMLGERFTITRGFGGCLFIFDQSQWRNLEERLEEGNVFNRDKIRLQRHLFSWAHEVSPDSQGRVAIPQELREFAGIKENGEAQISGCLNRIEIWNRERYDEFMKVDLGNDDELLDIATAMNI